jgi:multidrug efflux pump subunit AcrB
MWIVRLALRRPYSIAVGAIMIALLGFMSLSSMLIDIFPAIDIPVVGIVWAYNGLSAEDMEKRVVFLSERALSTTVNGISKVESESVPGVGLLRVYFQPGTDIGAAIAQISSVSALVLRSMPPGMTAPTVIQFNASNVPVAQMTIFSDVLPEEQLYDYAINFVRLRLFTIPGLSVPVPYGGKARQVNVDVNPGILNAKGLSPNDVTQALQASDIIVPAGTARIGKMEYNISLNSSPQSLEEFEKIPVKVVGGRPITIGDVAKVNDSFADQLNIVRVNGKRATYLNIMKKSDASTLTVVDSTYKLLPSIQALAPAGMKFRIDFDQSVFVRNAINSVLHEAVISSILVSIMILVFLGSWRSVIIVCTSIPLCILVSITGLKMLGHSINIMTLGGLSLAIGMLVDDATVAVENIHRNRSLGLPLTRAIIVGAEQIALPAIMATLSICIVFFPVVLLTGPAKFLFTPMALSVVFAMLASYILSRTLVPLLSRMLMAGEPAHDPEHAAKGNGFFAKFERLFNSVQARYAVVLKIALENRSYVLFVSGTLLALTMFVPFLTGTDFFPATDTGLMKLHFRAPSGTRIEETERMVAEAENHIRKIIPEDELATINSMIGIPQSVNLAFVPTENTGAMDAEILVALKEDHKPTADYRQKVREDLALTFPAATMFFQAPDIVNQVLNFGLGSPIDVQIENRDMLASYEVALKLKKKMKAIPGMADVSIKQILDYPTLKLNVDRVRASELGLTQRDISNSLLISLSSSVVVAPTYYLNPKNSVNYIVAVKTPLESLASVSDVLGTTITGPGGLAVGPTIGLGSRPQAQAERLGNLVTMTSGVAMNEINHTNVQRVINVTGNVEGRDLGSVQSGIDEAIASLGQLPPGMAITVRGQGETMRTSFRSLGLGIILAIFLVYLLMVILFQSWLDPFIVIVAVPGALVGILWMLLITGTTINVESLMGAIMAVGIAASNSILLVSYANDVRVEKGLGPIEAAFEAGVTRLRPVLMTALAMVIGMIPAALALGEGGEQNAPLGRAVIGGLIVATTVTLLVVPVVYSLLRTELPTKQLLDERLAKEEAEGLEHGNQH